MLSELLLHSPVLRWIETLLNKLRDEFQSKEFKKPKDV